MENLKSYHERTKRAYDEGKYAEMLDEGDRVLLLKPKDRENDYDKLKSAFIGPYTVINKYNEHNYKIRDDVTKNEIVEHRSHLRKIPKNLHSKFEQHQPREKFKDEGSPNSSNEGKRKKGTMDIEDEQYYYMRLPCNREDETLGLENLFADDYWDDELLPMEVDDENPGEPERTVDLALYDIANQRENHDKSPQVAEGSQNANFPQKNVTYLQPCV